MRGLARGGVVGAVVLLLIACTDTSTPDSSGAGGAGASGGAGGALSCAPPEVELDGTCALAGIPEGECADGFAPNGGGGCLPILPDESCPDGLVALFGETTCRPLIDCGSDTWANIPMEAGTEYVDPAYDVGDSDGSMAKPTARRCRNSHTTSPRSASTRAGVEKKSSRAKSWKAC